eukprot:scaffold1542_cov251-Chaetoceros_neogracile.AAC.16
MQRSKNIEKLADTPSTSQRAQTQTLTAFVAMLLVAWLAQLLARTLAREQFSGRPKCRSLTNAMKLHAEIFSFVQNGLTLSNIDILLIMEGSCLRSN